MYFIQREPTITPTTIPATFLNILIIIIYQNNHYIRWVPNLRQVASIKFNKLSCDNFLALLYLSIYELNLSFIY